MSYFFIGVLLLSHHFHLSPSTPPPHPMISNTQHSPQLLHPSPIRPTRNRPSAPSTDSLIFLNMPTFSEPTSPERTPHTLQHSPQASSFCPPQQTQKPYAHVQHRLPCSAVRIPSAPLASRLIDFMLSADSGNPTPVALESRMTSICDTPITPLSGRYSTMSYKTPDKDLHNHLQPRRSSSKICPDSALLLYDEEEPSPAATAWDTTENLPSKPFIFRSRSSSQPRPEIASPLKTMVDLAFLEDNKNDITEALHRTSIGTPDAAELKSEWRRKTAQLRQFKNELQHDLDVHFQKPLTTLRNDIERYNQKPTYAAAASFYNHYHQLEEQMEQWRGSEPHQKYMTELDDQLQQCLQQINNIERTAGETYHQVIQQLLMCPDNHEEFSTRYNLHKKVLKTFCQDIRNAQTTIHKPEYKEKYAILLAQYDHFIDVRLKQTKPHLLQDLMDQNSPISFHELYGFAAYPLLAAAFYVQRARAKIDFMLHGHHTPDNRNKIPRLSSLSDPNNLTNQSDTVTAHEDELEHDSIVDNVPDMSTP